MIIFCPYTFFRVDQKNIRSEFSLMLSPTILSYLGQWSTMIMMMNICDDMELPHTKGRTNNPWNKCSKRGLLTTGGQIPIEKHYRSLFWWDTLTFFLISLWKA